MSRIDEIDAELRVLCDGASDLEVFRPMLTLLREARGEDAARVDALVERARGVLAPLLAAEPIRAERKAHWTFSNHTALVDPCNVGVSGASKLDPSRYDRPAFGLARTFRVRNAGRRDTKLTTKYGAMLAELEAFEAFEGLEILEQSLGPEGVAEFAASPHLKNLKALSISGSKSGAGGAEAVASNPALSGLEILILSQGRIGDSGAAAIAQSPHLKNLKVLVLEENQIGARGVEALAASPGLAGLEHLCLNSNKKVGAAGVKALAESPHLRSLKVLRLRGVNMRTTGARALADSPLLDGLTELVAFSNGITDKGEETLRASARLQPGCVVSM
jgi:hypothetical protein